MKLLHIDSSALGDQSVSREVSASIVAAWQTAEPDLQIDRLDLDAEPLPHLTGHSLSGADAALTARESDLLQQFLDADVVVLGAPMYNFGIPSTLKAWIDRIAIRGKTFHYSQNGPEGLAGGKRVVVASSRGGALGETSPMDFQEAYLRQVFVFLGVDAVECVRAEGVGRSPAHRDDAVKRAKASIRVPAATSLRNAA